MAAFFKEGGGGELFVNEMRTRSKYVINISHLLLEFTLEFPRELALEFPRELALVLP
jgi:hypothetical protein